MTDDIVEQLRWCRWKDRRTGQYTGTYDLKSIEVERLEAAAEIERLREQLKTSPVNNPKGAWQKPALRIPECPGDRRFVCNYPTCSCTLGPDDTAEARHAALLREQVTRLRCADKTCKACYGV